MNYKLVNRIFAGVVFLISLSVFFSTVQPSVSFWDCGEFIASGYYLQVPHPPGAPFFLLLGRILSMIPFADNIALRVNTISVFASAVSVLFLYLIAVKLIENYKGKEYKSPLGAIGIFTAAAIGALSFSFSDTFWFNGVEAEVYAFSTFLFSSVVWLMMLWHEKADQKDNEKYILMIAYLIGISTGVHLMSVLTIVPVVMVIMFRKYVDDEEVLKKSGFIFLIHAAIVIVIALAMWGAQTSTTPPTQEQYQDYDTKFKMIVAGISLLIIGGFWKKLFNRNSIYMPLIIGGIALFAIYPGVVKFLPSFMTSIAGDNVAVGIGLLILIFAVLAYLVNYSIKKGKNTLHLIAMSFIFILISFTTFAMVIIRSNQNPPMNENEPNDFSELVSYLNREQYGDFPTFKRRFATEPHQQGVYSNYKSDLDFFWRYQMNHMFTRYLLWNYAGRESWDQDAPADIAPFNSIGNLFGKVFGLSFEGKVKDSLFAVPFLLGLLGIYFQFRNDWKMASVFMVMFFLMGILTAFYQNQQEPQPRERDYFYVGAFFVYSIWIAIGIKGLLDLALAKIPKPSFKTPAVVTILLLGIILVPVKMLSANYFTHDRSHNWVPWDYSYNLLQSVAPNGVLFTNGDNDTFPLWYLQDVEGVRRDVRIANLSLLNTSWYIKQLKNNDPYKVGTIKMRLSDVQIESIRPIQWQSQNVTIPLPSQTSTAAGLSDFIQRFNIEDSSAIKSDGVTFKMDPTLNFGNVKAVRVQDLMVKEIVESNNWERPIYFAVTCSEDSKIGLSDYLRMEGMALRLVPEKGNKGGEFVNEKVMEEQLFNENPGYSKDFKPGFKFRGLNDPNIFFDENHQRMTQNYRNAYIRLALSYLSDKRKDLAVKTLDVMEEKIPHNLIDMNVGLLFEVGNLYYSAGAMDKYKKIADEVEQKAITALNADPNDTRSYYNPYRLLMGTYENLKEYGKLLDLWNKLKSMYPEDPNVKANVAKYQGLVNAAKKDQVKIDSVQNPVPDSMK
ncbi:MAG: DUF2723 domain-containing protein [Ignavibacteriaceae bacterium]